MLKEAALLLEQDFTASLKILSFIGTCTFNYYIVSDWCYDFTVASPLLTFLTEIPEYE